MLFRRTLEMVDHFHKSIIVNLSHFTRLIKKLQLTKPPSILVATIKFLSFMYYSIVLIVLVIKLVIFVININHFLACMFKVIQVLLALPIWYQQQSMYTIYYGIVVIGSMIIALVFYNLVMFVLRANKHLLHPPTTISPVKEKGFDSSRLNPLSVTTFKYKKGAENIEAASETECVVCLSSFEDDECVSRLPQCKHSFHAPCIDMWLYSHSDCPLCRTSIDRLSTQNGAKDSKENTQDVIVTISI